MEQRETISIIPTDPPRAREYLVVPLPAPSVEHSLVDCDRCGRKGWIGPAERMKSLFNDVDVLCYWCIGEEMEGGAEFEINKPLDWTADDEPSR